MRVFFIFILVVATIFTPSSCEDFKLSVNCDECYISLPNKYSIKINVTIDEENPFVPITFYEGKIDDGKIIDTDTIYATPYYSILVNFDHYYSAIAKYSHKGRVIYAVDGRKLSKKLDKSSCNNSCYVINGDELDLRLK